MNQDLMHILHDMVLNASNGKPAKVIAEEVGKPYVTLLNELNPGNEDHKLGVALLVPLLRATGDDAPVHHLARLLGGVFIPLPKASGSARESCAAAIKAVAEVGDMMRAFEQSLTQESEGGVDMTKAELEKFRLEAHEALTAIMAFLMRVEAEFKEREGRIYRREER